MKNKLVLALILLSITGNRVLAIQDPSVIKDDATKTQVMDAFDNLNQYTDNFFTPAYTKKNKEDDLILKDDKVEDKKNNNKRGTVPIVKKLRLKYQASKDPKSAELNASENAVVASPNQAILDCEEMEYFAERTELEANGHVVMFFPKNNSTIKADKVVYNQTSNLIKAFGNVVLITDGKELLGDYMQLDMNEENGYMDNPNSDLFQIRARAKKGYLYGDRIIQEQGSLYVKNKMMIKMRTEMYGPNFDGMYVDEKDRAYYKKDAHGEQFKIKTNDLIINAKKEHDLLTLKHAELYFKDKKVATIPSITMHTNKNQDYIEAAYPEFGTLTNIGMYAGPGFVFDTFKGSTLKVIPILNYQSNGDNSEDNKLGWGGIAKFKSGTNKTDMYYGTSNSIFMMRGLQKLDDNLYFQYASNGYMDDWFMGFRMPKLLGELVYQDAFANQDFLAKGMDMNFSHRLAAAYAQDGPAKSPLFDGEGGVGTMRFKYMAEVAQTLYNFGSSAESPINARLEMIGQGSTAVYGTGDTQMVARIGPRLHTQYKNWMQDAGYFLSAYDDKSPLKSYDSYVYGRSNVYLRETMRLNKYLALSWFGSLNLSQDGWSGKLIQENAFFLSLGPEDIKLHIGYDTIRQQTFVTMSMDLDAKGSTIEYKKMTIINPEKVGKTNDESSREQSFSSPPSGEIEAGEDGIMHAEVIDIKEAI